MRLTDRRSISIILAYVLGNGAIFFFSLKQVELPSEGSSPSRRAVLPEYTEIEQLDYFHLRNALPQLSLSAVKMRSQGEVEAEFYEPKGVYTHQKKNESIRYQALEGIYLKQNEVLKLMGEVKISSSEANYEAQTLDYFFKDDLLQGTGGITFRGEDKNTQDTFIIQSQNVRANPGQKLGRFTGGVQGSMERRKKYEGKMTFASQQLDLDNSKSLAHLEGDVRLKRGGYDITAGKADIYLENYNKSLKYFVLNDDVKVTETVSTPQGVTERKAYSERLEGFGRENKMILSGAPRVEQGNDVIKGYRITIRENADLIEVDDAMSDVQVKRKDKLKE